MQPHLGQISTLKMPDNFSLGPVMINEYFMSSDEKGERDSLNMLPAIIKGSRLFQ